MKEAPRSRPSHPVIAVIDVLSGLKLAGVLILLLGVLTWLGTLEQIDQGLFAVKKKYFSSETFFIFPELNGRTVPIPLPNAYWVGVLFFINLLLGTLLRVRRGWKTIGVLVAHFGMLLLLVGAFVTQHFSERGNIPVYEGETRDVAEHYTDYVIEVAELGREGPELIHVVDTPHLVDLDSGDQRLFRMKNLPFDLEVSNYVSHARPRSVVRRPPEKGERVLDGFYLEEQPFEKEAERRWAGCILSLMSKEGERKEELLLSPASYFHPTVRWEDRVYLVQIRKKLWQLPFQIRLEDFRHEYHPGTLRPKSFESSIVRLDDDREEPVEIKMNEPMRYEGYTFFQASWGPQENATPDTELFSVFEVVKNPADKWPEYSLWIIGIGLLIHFVMQLVRFVLNQNRKNAKEVPV